MNTIISLKDIEAAYDSQPVLTGANFDITEHDYVGICGPNGGGKTTLMKVLLGIIKPTAGKVTYYKDGHETTHITMGYLPQYNKIDKAFPISVYDAILTGLTTRNRLLGRFTEDERQKVDGIINRMKLNGLENRPISALSGGQLQRILLARALVSCPDILVLDEPNTYIDEAYQAQMYALLDTLNRECAVALVSHDIEELTRHARHIVFVNNKVTHFDRGEATAEELKKHIFHTLQQ